MQQFIECVPNDGISFSKCYIKLHLAAFISSQGSNWQGINGKLVGKNILHQNSMLLSNTKKSFEHLFICFYRKHFGCLFFNRFLCIEWFELVLFYWIIKRYGMRTNSFFNKPFETKLPAFQALTILTGKRWCFTQFSTRMAGWFFDMFTPSIKF